MTPTDVTEIRFYPSKGGHPSIIGNASVTFSTGLVVKNFTIWKSKNGGAPYITMPSKEYEKNGEKKYQDIVFFLNKDDKLLLEQLILTKIESVNTVTTSNPYTNKSNPFM